MTGSADTIYDESLVLAAQAGDGAAFEELLRRWLPIIRRHAERLTGEGTGAEDVSQEACLAVARGLKQLDDPALARVWMLRILTNKASDWVRRRQRDRQLQQDVKNLEPRGPLSDHHEEAGSEGRNARIRAACQALPVDLRAVVSLYYGEGLSVAAVAAALGVPAGTIKSRLHDARTQVRTFLERNTA